MAHAHDGARTYGKSDAIDAFAVARAALREPSLPCARLDGLDRELRLLTTVKTWWASERVCLTGCVGTCKGALRLG